MKYKKNKLRSAMHGFYFLVKFCLVLIYILKVCFKRSFSILLIKKYSIHYLHFSFEKHVLSQFLKDFSVENVETTPSSLLSKFSCEIYFLELLIIRVLLLHYIEREERLLSSVRIFFISFFFFFFYRYFPWQILTIHRIAGKGEKITH